MSLRAEWASYCTLLPESAGPTQIAETEQAFYGGAQACMTMLARHLTAGPEVESLVAELGAYIERRFGAAASATPEKNPNE